MRERAGQGAAVYSARGDSVSAQVRRLVKRLLPYQARWRGHVLLRHIGDARSGAAFAHDRARPETYPHQVCSYERPLICYPGQESVFQAKCRNNERALRAIDCLAIGPGEMFSFWRCVGRPTRRADWEVAAALKNGTLTTDIGGAICLASTLLYNIGLLSGMTVVERYCHSVDSYGDARYFELGRDAAVEFPYRDLRLRNDIGTPVLLRCRMDEQRIVAEAWSQEPLDLSVAIRVGQPEATVAGHHRVHTKRVVQIGGGPARLDDLGWSVYGRSAPSPGAATMIS